MPMYEYTVNVIVEAPTEYESIQRLDAVLADDRIIAVNWMDGGDPVNEAEYRASIPGTAATTASQDPVLAAFEQETARRAALKSCENCFRQHVYDPETGCIYCKWKD